MSTANRDNANPETGQDEESGVERAIRAGIYLEEKKSTIGTGGTAKAAEYRTFWVTLSVTETKAVMILLDDDFKPTAIKETFALEVIAGPGWHYIAEGEKRYQRLRPYLNRMLTPAVPEQAPQGSGNWWEGGRKSSGSDKKKTSATSTKKNWWS